MEWLARGLRRLDRVPWIPFSPCSRSWAQFLDVRKFARPSPDKIERRVATNLYYFRGNYLAICVLFVVLPFFNPYLIVYLVAITAAFYWLRAQDEDWSLDMLDYHLPKDRIMFFYLSGILCWGAYMLYKLIQQVFACLALSLIMVVVHSALRQRFKRCEEIEDFADLFELDWVNGED